MRRRILTFAVGVLACSFSAVDLLAAENVPTTGTVTIASVEREVPPIGGGVVTGGGGTEIFGGGCTPAACGQGLGLTGDYNQSCNDGQWASLAFPMQTNGSLVTAITVDTFVTQGNGIGFLFLMGDLGGPNVNNILYEGCFDIDNQTGPETIEIPPTATGAVTWLVEVFSVGDPNFSPFWITGDDGFNQAGLGFGNLSGNPGGNQWQDLVNFGFGWCFCQSLTVIDPNQTGACCDDATAECNDDTPILDCLDPNLRFEADTLCADLAFACGEPAGACCGDTPQDCTNVSEADCIAGGGDTWTGGVLCEDEGFACGFAICGDAGTGDCETDTGTPGCEDLDCCNRICGFDSFCCQVAWDATCAGEAIDQCCPRTECTDQGCTLTQSVGDTIDNAVACGAAGPPPTTTPNAWARCFDLTEEEVPGALNINSVTFGIAQLESSTNDTVPVNVNIYTSTCPPTFSTAQLIGTASTTVTALDVGTLRTVTFDNPPFVPAGASIVVEIEAPEDGGLGTPGNNHAFRVAANDLGQCGPSYLRATQCGNANWTDLNDIGFPDSHTFMSIEAVAGEECILSVVSSTPPSDAIDARQPFEPDGANVDGWDSIAITFASDASCVTADAFSVTTNPPGAAPGISGVTINGDTATLTFDQIIPLQAWTIVTYDPSGESVRIGYLPADVGNDRLSNANDVLTAIDNLNGVIPPLADYQCDVDRTGACNANDVLRVIDLLNGAGVYDVFNGASLPD
ncbi:MAG: hypothetical protein ACE5E6_00160 [Phycisphaerae bacterium]